MLLGSIAHPVFTEDEGMLHSPWPRSMLAVLALCWCTAAANDAELTVAIDHLQQGRHDEARNEFERILSRDALSLENHVRAAVGLSRTYSETGHAPEAIAVLDTALMAEPKSPRLWARRAELYFDSGAYDRAAEDVRKALDLDSQYPPARWIEALLHTEAGRIDEAATGFRWFVRYYNQRQPTDWETLVVIGQGASQYARWESVSPIFRFVVNTLCPDALRDNPRCWQAAVLSGELLLEKYNQEQAVPEFEQALQINPRCVPAFVALGRAAIQDHKLSAADRFADEALAINPRSVDALLLKIDVRLLADNDARARPFIESALHVNPRDQRILARRAVVDLFETHLPTAGEFRRLLMSDDSAVQESPLTSTLRELRSRNPRPGPFYAVLGEFLDARRKYGHAEVVYRAAIEAMPQLSAPRTNLGLLCMRTGRVEEAETILNQAFQSDPFHVRVSNMRKVIGVLKTYETIETDHFVIRVAASERFLGRRMADYLEGIYPELTERYGYEPPTRTQFEIYSDAQGVSGHAWFSARMVGLPWIQTIGASTGVIVAVTSPVRTEHPYHWGRVLRHEFVHILTLQKSGFNIPHWLTEAIAVTEEQMELPDRWQEMLLSRVPAGEVFQLKTLNEGFQKPRGPEDWQMAYCQSLLYAQFLRQKFGDDALVKLLDAFRETSSTAAAFQNAFTTTLEEFETEFTSFLRAQVAEISRGRPPLPVPLAAAQKAVNANEDDAAAHADLAYALWRQGEMDDAVEHLERSLGLNPRQSLAAVLRARQLAAEQNPDAAFEQLRRGWEDESPHPLLMDLLAREALRRQEFDLAETVLKQAIERYPLQTDFLRLMVQAADGLNRPRSVVRPMIETIVRRDGEEGPLRKRLARMAAERQDHSAAVHWAREGLYVDPLDAELYRIVGTAHRHSRELTAAIAAYENLVELEEATADDRFSLAELLKRTGRHSEARNQLTIILNQNPRHRPASTLLKLIDRGL